ncbi:hypothetical protein JHK82_024352 [Glycine max]|nr:hypothetical protein JHK85_024935 [Glycine max]KAG5012183.1 hypothetical protein JHK86_024444 [Glycine max]KAG5133164.1 hypothetical protein JHK82_024352 [Glycine max]
MYMPRNNRVNCRSLIFLNLSMMLASIFKSFGFVDIYVWIGYNSAKLGHMYAAASTGSNNLVSVTSILGGVSDNTGFGIAHRSVLKTGLNIILACSIPKNSPTLETQAEKILIQKLISLGYTKSRLGGTS